MPRKKKTSLGWSAAGTFPVNPLTASEFQDIATVLEVDQIDSEIAEKIISAVQNYHINNEQIANVPRPSTIKNSLEKIRDDTKSVRSVLDAIDSKTLDVLFHTTQGRPQGNISAIIERCTKDLKIINQATRSALINHDFKDRGGRPVERKALKILLLDLKEIFEKVTGQPARQPAQWSKQDIGGFFFEFCFTIVQYIDGSIQPSILKAQIKSIFPST